MLRGIIEILFLLILTFAWVSGQLDPLQKKLQEILLDTMGETKVSYGLKSDVSPSYTYTCVTIWVVLTSEQKV
jgi:hypothetical protein